MDLYKSSIYRIFRDAQSRKLLICGYDEAAKKIFRKLCLLDIKPLGFLVNDYVGEKLKKNAKRGHTYVYSDLAKMNMHELRIIITRQEQSRDLEALGLSRGENYRSISYYDSRRQEYKLDPTIGYNLITDTETPGFKQFGNPKSKNIIVTLGNSTSDPVLFPFRCWSEILGEKITQNNLDLKILCGAVSGHTSSQELLKLLRDVIPMHPQMVICYEGFQDMNIAFSNKSFQFILPYQKEWLESLDINSWINIYYTKGYTLGIDNNLSCYQTWKKNMRMMNTLCEEFGIKFISILQPSLFNKYPNCGKRDWEVVLHYELRDDYLDWFRSFFEEYVHDEEKLEYVHDYTEVFDNLDGMYMDNCHVYEEGNQLIADKIYSDFFK